MEFAPDAVECMLKSGHEIAAHSYTQDALMAYLKPDEERAMIEKCVGVFKKLTGAPPKGWLSPVLAPTAAYRRAHRRSRLPLVRRLQPHRPAVLRRHRQGHAGGAAAYGFRRSPRAARQSARLVRRLQGHVRLSLRERTDVLPQHHGALPFRRPAADGGADRSHPEIYSRLPRRLARASRRIGAMGQRQQHWRMDQPAAVFPRPA